MRYKIFISGVQKELKTERKVLKDYIHGDALLRKFFEVFIFEDLPASDRRADEVYLEEVKVSDIYLGLFGNEYGSEDSKGLSATHKEFLLASQLGKPRLIFVKGDNDSSRNVKMRALLKAVGDQLIRRRFNTQPELHAAVYAALVNHLLATGSIVTGPFDATMCRNAKINDISEDKIRWFLAEARSFRNYALSQETPVEYDIPKEVVGEGIVNAVAHRDYTSNASVEIMLFSDRLEIWNPGTLPPSLTIESLSRSHPSQPGNPLLAEPLFLTKYIEKAGTGTVDMFDNCKKAGLRPPKFRLENGFFVLTVWRKKVKGQPESSTSPVPVQYQSLDGRILALLKKEPLPVSVLSRQLGQKRVSGQLKIVLKKLLSDSLIEFTIPDRPQSRLQKYRLTKKGTEYLKKQGKK